MNARLYSAVMRWETLLAALLLAVIIVGTLTSDVFFEGSNLTVISGVSMEKAVMALPMTLIIIAGEIDLSVASILGLVQRRAGQDLGGRAAPLALHHHHFARRRGRWVCSTASSSHGSGCRRSSSPLARSPSTAAWPT